MSCPPVCWVLEQLKRTKKTLSLEKGRLKRKQTLEIQPIPEKVGLIDVQQIRMRKQILKLYFHKSVPTKKEILIDTPQSQNIMIKKGYRKEGD